MTTIIDADRIRSTAIRAAQTRERWLKARHADCPIARKGALEEWTRAEAELRQLAKSHLLGLMAGAYDPRIVLYPDKTDRRD